MFRSTRRLYQAKKIYENSPFSKINRRVDTSPTQGDKSTGNVTSFRKNQPKKAVFNESKDLQDYRDLEFGNYRPTRKLIVQYLRKTRLYAFLAGTRHVPKEGKKKPFLQSLEESIQNIPNERRREFLLKLLQGFRVKLDMWVHMLVPDLSLEAEQKQKTFVMKGAKRAEKVYDTAFLVPMGLKLFILVLVLSVYFYQAICRVIEDTQQGKMLQEAFKELIRTKILLDYKEDFSKFDAEGEENDITKGLSSLNRDEIIFLFHAMNWFTIGHKTFVGLSSIGDSNPMVAAVFLNSHLHRWMLNMLAEPSSVSTLGNNDYELITECTEALNRFCHDETVARQVVSDRGLTILSVVKERLMQQKNGMNASSGLGEGKYTVDNAIHSIDRLICRIFGYRWTHDEIQDDEVKRMIPMMITDRKTAESFVSSITGSWWSRIASKDHLFERNESLRQEIVSQLKSRGYDDLAQNVEKNTLMANTVHQLWTYTMKHRETWTYMGASAAGVGLTIAATFLTSRWLIQRKLAKANYKDGYILPFVNGFAIFLSALCAGHYFVLYPHMLTEIRKRVEMYEKDVNMLFKGSFLPLCIHNYKIFAGYIGAFFFIAACSLLAIPTLSILVGSSISGMIALLLQIYTTPNVEVSDFFRSLNIIFWQQVRMLMSNPSRLLFLKLIVDEDSEHIPNAAKAVQLREEATSLLKRKKLQAAAHEVVA